MANYRSDQPETFETAHFESSVNSVLCQLQSWYEELLNPTEERSRFQHVVTLWGPPGVGKTSVCTKFITHVLHKYPNLQVLWAEGRTIESLVSFLEQYNSHSCEVDRCSSEIFDHHAKLLAERFAKSGQKAILVILPGRESQASNFVVRLIHYIENPTQLQKLCVINLALNEKKRTTGDTVERDATSKVTRRGFEDLNVVIKSHLAELVDCTVVNKQVCTELYFHRIITRSVFDKLVNTSSNSDRAIYLYTAIAPTLAGDERLEILFKEALKAGGNLKAIRILEKMKKGLNIELKKPKALDAAKLIRQINSSISSEDIEELCNLTNFNPLLLKVSAALITFDSPLFGNSASKFIREVQKLKNSESGSATGENLMFPFIKYACDYLESNYHLGQYVLKILKLSPNLKTWLPVHEFQSLKFPGGSSEKQLSPNLVSLKWLANLGFIHFTENQELFRVSSTVKDYFDAYTLNEESPNFVLEAILLNIRKTENFTESVINPFGKIMEALSPPLMNILGNHAMAILRQPALRKEIAKSKGISVKLMLKTIKQELQKEPINLEKSLELDAFLAENSYFEGKQSEAFEIFRNTCTLAHTKLNATNLTFLRIAETFCFYLGIENLDNEAQFLFDRIVLCEEKHGKRGIIDEEAMAARKVYYRSWKHSGNLKNTEKVTENLKDSIELLQTVDKVSNSHPQQAVEETIETSHKSLSAVQIVNMKTQPNGSSHFILQESVLRQILEEVEDRHIYIISIAGATRQGKSFLMNVIRHYLDAVESGSDSPWESIGQLDKLEGFHIENKNIRDTIGFWMWPRPFVFKQKNGKEIAVLLMDTQGVFDKFTSKKEWSMIVGLSLLTSSCIIYNLLNNLLEDNLEILKSFVEFGQLAVEKNSGKESATKSAFHKLLFLIRDWGFPNDVPYGPEGGNKFIDNHFKILPQMSKEAQLVRQTLRNVFKELDCFLMPHPGSAAKQNDFKGSLRNLNPEFLENLKNFLHTLCKTDELEPLAIAGKEVRGTDLFSYFSTFTELLNKQEIPNSTSIYDAVAIIQKFADSAKQEIEAQISKEGFLSDVELKDKYDSISKKVMDRFNQKMKNNPSQSNTDYSRLLIQILKSQFAFITIKNLNGKRQRINEVIATTKEKYAKEIEAILKKVTNSSVDIEKVLAACEAVVLLSSTFESKDETFLGEILPKLHSMIQETNLFYREKYTLRIKDEESDYESHFQNLLQDYDLIMNTMMSDEDLITADPERLVELHNNCEEKILKELCKRVEFKEQLVKDTAITELKSKTSQRLEARLVKLRKCQDESVSKAMILIQQALDNYSKQLKENLTEHQSETEIASVHHMLKLEANQVMGQVYSIVGSREALKMKETLDQKIAELYENSVFQEKLRRDNLSDKNWESEINEAVQSYEKKVKAYIESQPYPTDDELERFIESTQETIVEAAEDSEWLRDNNLKSKLQMEIKERLRLLQKSLVQHHKSLINESIQLCFEDTKRSELYYEELLRDKYDTMKRNNSLSIQNLKSAHTLLANVCVEQFKTKWSAVLPYSSFNHVVIYLESHTDEVFLNLSKQVKMYTVTERTAIEKIVIDCFEIYTDKMNSNVSEIRDTNKLEKLHYNAKSSAEKRFAYLTRNSSSLPEFETAKMSLISKINRSYSQQLHNFRQRQQILDNQIEELLEESVNIYLEEFSLRRDEIRNENELNSVHLEVLKISMTNLDVKISANEILEEISVQRLLTERSKLEGLLAEQFQKQLQQWKSRQSKLEEEIENVFENIRIDYQKAMRETQGKFDFTDDSKLEATHQSVLKESVEKIRDAVKPLTMDPSAYQTQVENDLNKLFQTISRENTSKRENVMEKIHENVRLLKKKYQILQINNPSTWESKAVACKHQITSILNHHNLPDEVQRQLVQKLTLELKSAEAETATKMEHNQRLKTKISFEPLPKETLSTRHDEAPPLSKLQEYSTLTSSVPSNEAILSEFDGDFPVPCSGSPGTFSLRQDASGIHTQIFNSSQGASSSFQGASSSFQGASSSSRGASKVKSTVKKNIVIAIDFGLSYCRTAYYDNNQVKIIPFKNGKNHIRSTVRFASADEVVVGEDDLQLQFHPTQSHPIIFDTKRLIGRTFDHKEVQDNLKLWPFQITSHNNIPKIEVHNQSFSAEQIHSIIIKYLKENAEMQLGCEVKQAVITVPAYFTDAQKTSTKNAARTAGLEVLEILNEPTAAAIAHNLHLKDAEPRNIFLFGFGAGALDLSILSTHNGKLQVKGIGGNNYLGGRDIDTLLIEYCLTEFKRINNISPETAEDDFDETCCSTIISRIRNHCEVMKISLSSDEKYQLVVPHLYKDKDLELTLTRIEFENLIEPILQEAIKACGDLLMSSSLTVKDISDVILVGGCSRIPRLQELLKVFFERGYLCMTFDPEEVVVRGAAYRAAMIRDEELSKTKLDNVSPYGVWVDLDGEKSSLVIPKNTLLPASSKLEYSLTSDSQSKMNMRIFVGDNVKADESNVVANIPLREISTVADGEEQVELTLEMDKEGFLSAFVFYKSTGTKIDVEINSKRK